MSQVSVIKGQPFFLTENTRMRKHWCLNASISLHADERGALLSVGSLYTAQYDNPVLLRELATAAIAAAEMLESK